MLALYEGGIKNQKKMKFITNLTLILMIVFLFSALSVKAQLLELSGKVGGTDTESIILVKLNQSLLVDPIIQIPVHNGKFTHKAKLEHPEAFKLYLGEAIKGGSSRFMLLFLENEKIELNIYPEAFDKTYVEGGTLNAAYKAYNTEYDLKFHSQMQVFMDSIKSIYDTNNYYSDQMKVVLAALENSNSQVEKAVLYKKKEDLEEKDLDLTPKAKKLKDKSIQFSQKTKNYQQDYIAENPTLVSYALFMDDLIYKKETVDINLARHNYNKLSQAHPNHPYNAYVLGLIDAIDAVKIGKKFTDFTAPNLNGNTIKLSDKINGQVALLDLWATWCSPCIEKSRTMLPVYKEFKDRGFTIVGVAGEFNTTNRLVRFLEKEQWPWLNLVELDRENNIWQKYGVDGGGGAMFLIDENGKILAKNPTAEEVTTVLKTRLK